MIDNIKLKKNRIQGICQAHGCRHHADGRFCGTHKRQKQRIVNELMYCYGNLKQNAKRRCIAFGLTKAQFQAFCDQTGYLAMRGRSSGALTIDRINSDKGYTIDNIRAIPLRDNVIKSWFERRKNNGSSLPAPGIDITGIVPIKKRASNCPF